MTGPSDTRHPNEPVDRRRLLRRVGALGAMGLAVPTIAGCRILAARADDRYTVRMTAERQFEPASLTVKAGSTVVWKNEGHRRHAVTTDAADLEGEPGIALPDGVVPFRSPDLTTGETWRLRFIAPGTYVYACPYHYRENMLGSITVEET